MKISSGTASLVNMVVSFLYNPEQTPLFSSENLKSHEGFTNLTGFVRLKSINGCVMFIYCNNEICVSTYTNGSSVVWFFFTSTTIFASPLCQVYFKYLMQNHFCSYSMIREQELLLKTHFFCSNFRKISSDKAH